MAGVNNETSWRTLETFTCSSSFTSLPQLVYTGHSKESLALRELQLSVLSAESLRENCYLGGVTLRLKDFDLSKDTVKWYKLTAVPYF